MSDFASKTVHYAIERGADGQPSALFWSAAIQAEADSCFKAWERERWERNRQAAKPMAACLEWAKARGLWQ